ncbi:MAG TPA: hypothetical protein VIH40_10395 [Xanthobacteraceae bacterium]
MRFLIVSALLLWGSAAAAPLRKPSCEVLVALTYAGRAGAIEQFFGKPIDKMTVDEIGQAIDIVADCIDAAEAGPPDVPGLLPRERKHTQINALTMLTENLRYYRNSKRERDRRAGK